MDTDLNALSDTFPYVKMTLHRISELFSPVLGHLNELLSVITVERRTDCNETTLKEESREKKRKSKLRSLILDSWADLAEEFGNKWVKPTDGHEKEEKLLIVSAELH